MMILAACAYTEDENDYAPDAFVLKLTPEVMAALKNDMEYLGYFDDTKRFAFVAFDTPNGSWVNDPELSKLLAYEEAVVLDWTGCVPDDEEIMDRQCHWLRSNGEISFHAREKYSQINFSTEPMEYAWLAGQVEDIEKKSERILMELGF
jgi:hypothetical protein